MNKVDRLAFVEKKLKQDRFIITFNDSKVYQLFLNSPYVKENINIIYANNRLKKADIVFDKNISIPTMTDNLIQYLNIKKDDFSINYKGQGLSNLFPL